MSRSMSDLALKTASPPAPPAPKRRHTTAARSLPPTNINVRSRRDPLRISQEKFCKATLDHLYRAEFETWALPFLGPVGKSGVAAHLLDPQSWFADLNAYPEYLTLIKQPMDFGTISDKLSHGVYATAEDFQTDVKLVFSNCYAFNPTWAPV
jgi:bromodomain-containing factor 1